MKLGKKQELFAELFGQQIVWAYEQGYALRIGEVHRPEATARYYASIGKGIVNSVHRRKLAADVFMVEDGILKWDGDCYLDFGVHWEGLHDLCRWGGRFQRRDVYHISLIHKGVY